MSRIATRITRSGRTLEDAFFRKAKAAGFVARSAYKLEELQRRFRLIPPRGAILDLGCHPGAWLQVACRELGPRGGAVVGVDLNPAVAVPQRHCDARVRVLCADARDLAPREWRELIPADKDGFDAVLSDMCHATLGAGSADAARSAQLVRTALDVALGKGWDLDDDEGGEGGVEEVGEEGDGEEAGTRAGEARAEGGAKVGAGTERLGAGGEAELHARSGGEPSPLTGGEAAVPMAGAPVLSTDSAAASTASPSPSSSSPFPSPSSSSLPPSLSSSPPPPQSARPGVLAYGGNVALKILQGPDTPALGVALRRRFAKVAWLRPQATRSESSETYLVGLGRLTDAERRTLDEQKREKKEREKAKKLQKKNKRAKKKSR